MRTLSRGKAAVAGLMALGLAFVATPAFAAPAEQGTLEVANTTFEAGSWGAGVDVTLTDIPADAENVRVTLGMAAGPSAGSGIMDVAPDDQGAGTYTTVLLPTDGVPSAPNADGYPVYTVGATYELPGVDEPYWLEYVQLTITGEPSAIQGPATASISALAGGITLQLTGFLPNEPVEGFINLSPDWDEVGPFEATIGADGTGTGVLTIPGARVGDEFVLNVYNESNQSASYTVTAVADTAAPTKPERIETAAG